MPRAPCAAAPALPPLRLPSHLPTHKQMLNAAGYGRSGTELQLDLVYNPGGVFLAPPQAKLEPTYKQVRWGGGQG